MIQFQRRQDEWQQYIYLIIFYFFQYDVVKMYNSPINSIIDQNENQQELSPQFIISMMQAQQKYAKNRDQGSMKQLLCYYTDCINYFQLRDQAISQYFQAKIKDIVHQIKQFGTHQLALQNKQKMNKNIIRVMQAQNVQQHIAQSIKKQQKVNQAVEKIVKQQNQRLQKRLLKSKRSFAKSHSVTMSFTSIDSSPDIHPQIKLKKPLGLTSKMLFTKEIGGGYSDQEN